jgi:hypothetical protein
VLLDHRPLHGVELAIAREILDRRDAAAVDRGEQPDAGADRLVDESAVAPPGEEHGAGAAIPLVAALLGAGPTFPPAQPVEQGGGGGDPRHLAELVAEPEADDPPHQLPR